MENLKVDNS